MDTQPAQTALHPQDCPVGATVGRRRHLQRELAPPALRLARGHTHSAETILRGWLDGKAEHTIRNYRHDLEDFAAYLSGALGMSPSLDVNGALRRLFRQPSSSAHEIVLGFRSHLLSAHLSVASVNRHLATLRSLIRFARLMGIVSWHLEVPSLRIENRRETRGPAVDDVRRMLATARNDTETDTRNAAIVMTFYCLGLRVSELCGLRLEDTDLSLAYTLVRGKGRRELEPVPLPDLIVEAIQRYLKHRGSHPGPLFQRCGSQRRRNGPLSTRGVLRIVHQLGQRVGLRVGCHSLRHTSITQAAALGQRAGMGLDKIRTHSRHRSITTLITYVDGQGRAQVQRNLSDLVAGTLRDTATAAS